MKFAFLSRGLLALGALAGLPAVAHAQKSPSLGVDVGYSYFLDSKTRARFGSNVTDFGVGLGNISPSIEGRVGLDFSIVRPDSRDNGVKSDALVITIGPEYRRVYIPGGEMERQIAIQQAQQQEAQTYPPGTLPPGTPPPANIGGLPAALPYYGASANLIYAQVDSPLDGVDGNGFGVGGSVFAGVAFRQRFYLEARARATSDVKGFNFSRAGITAGVRF